MAPVRVTIRLQIYGNFDAALMCINSPAQNRLAEICVLLALLVYFLIC